MGEEPNKLIRFKRGVLMVLFPKKKKSKRRYVKKKKYSKKDLEDQALEDIEDFYKEKQKRVAEGIKAIQIKKIKSLQDFYNKESIYLAQKKKQLEYLYKSVQEHLDDLNQKIGSIKRSKKNEERKSEEISSLMKTVGNLESSLKEMKKTRRDLLSKEKKAVDKIHNLFNEAKFLNLGTEDFDKVKKVEDTLEYAVEEARHLVSLESEVLGTHFDIAKKFSKKQINLIKNINKQLFKLQEQRKKFLSERKFLLGNEKKTVSKLVGLKKKQEQLELRLLKILKEKKSK